MIECPHWSRTRDRGQGVCALGRYGGAPWVGNCQSCLARGENAPPADWPALLRPLKVFARAGDRGLGDIVARTVGPVGGEAFERWYLRAFGRPCGCQDRQAWLNGRYPLPAR